jgi:hypothetical protein
MNIQKKRKRSPYASDSESQTMVGDSTSEANNGLASGHTSPAEQRASSLDIGPKRTRLDGLSPASDLTIAQPAARAKVPSRLSELPPELLQHIFTFLPPLFLGRLLRVSRVINTLLDPTKVLPRVHHESRGCLSLLDQDHVWSVSRKRFIPGLPRPLSSVSELELWRLLLGSSCQFCGKRTTLDPPSAVSPWNSGPGTESVRIIWPFAVRSCGSCLSARLVKVMGGRTFHEWGALADPAPGNRTHVFSILCPHAWFAICILHSIAPFCHLSYTSERKSSSNLAIDQILLSTSG